MAQKIGPREAALRAQREAASKPQRSARDLAAALPATSGKRPVKRKSKRRKGDG